MSNDEKEILVALNVIVEKCTHGGGCKECPEVLRKLCKVEFKTMPSNWNNILRTDLQLAAAPRQVCMDIIMDYVMDNLNFELSDDELPLEKWSDDMIYDFARLIRSDRVRNEGE